MNDIHRFIAMADSENLPSAKNHESCASQCGKLDGEHPSNNLIDGENALGNPETKNVTCGCPDELDPSYVAVDLDLFSERDKVPDLECGRKTNVDEDEGISGDASLWVSTKRVLNNFLTQLDFGSLSEAKAVEPTFCLKGLYKPPVDPPRTGVEFSPHKSENKNGGKHVRIAEWRIENGNLNLKPSGKKPPRPPKPPRLPKACEDSSKDRVIKAALRKAKLEKLASRKKKQMQKSKTSDSSLWALVCTLCFCVIMVIQGTGLFSQGSSSAQITAAVPVQTETFHVHKYDNHVVNSESLHSIIQDQPSSSLHHFGPALDKAMHIQSDLKS